MSVEYKIEVWPADAFRAFKINKEVVMTRTEASEIQERYIEGRMYHFAISPRPSEITEGQEIKIKNILEAIATVVPECGIKLNVTF